MKGQKRVYTLNLVFPFVVEFLDRRSLCAMRLVARTYSACATERLVRQTTVIKKSRMRDVDDRKWLFVRDLTVDLGDLNFEKIKKLTRLRTLRIVFRCESFIDRLCMLVDFIHMLISLFRGEKHIPFHRFLLPGGLPSIEQMCVAVLLFDHDPGFDHVPSLRYLDLSNCAISAIPPSVFSLSNLQHLSLVGISSKHISESISELVNLRVLDLSCSDIVSLPQGLCRLRRLERLLLKNCFNLRSVPREIGDLALLRELNLRRSSIVFLPDSIGNLTLLKKLDLRVFSEIRLNHVGVLDGLRSLEKFLFTDADSNTMRVILRRTSLKKMDIVDWMDSSDLPDALGNLTNLRTLRLHPFGAEEVPPSIGNLVLLKELLLKGPKLQSLPKTFENLKNLKWVDLSGTLLSDVPFGMQQVQNLEVLTMRDCRNLRAVPGMLQYATNLQKMDLTYSPMELFHLCILPSSVPIRNLNLRDCYAITFIPECIGLLRSLEVLDLSGTSIYSVPFFDGNISPLRKLRLSQCRNLRYLPESLGMLTSLEKITLIETPIKSIPLFMKRHWVERELRPGIWEKHVDPRLSRLNDFLSIAIWIGWFFFYVVWNLQLYNHD